MATSAPAPPAPPTPPAGRRRALRGGLAVAIVALLAVLAVVITDRPTAGPAGGDGGAGAAPTGPVPPLYVSPAGRDTNDGATPATAMETIQMALEKAGPGTVVNLAPGVYHEELQTVRAGAPGAPITIKGPETGTDRAGRYQAVLYGTGRIVNIDHSWITLQGFTIDGQEQLAKEPFPTDLRTADAFKERVQDRVDDGRLVYVGSNDETRDVTGVTIDDMYLHGAGGECVRLRNNAHDNTVSNSVIEYCGMYGKDGDGKRAEYHNGEGVYIGTSPKSKDQPMAGTDTSSGNVVKDNVIRTFGSECMDVKENAHDNVFEGNRCAANAENVDFEGSNIELRGYANVVRNNTIADSLGYNVKIQNDGGSYDKGGNVVQDNKLSGAAGEAFKVKSSAQQGAMCGNTVAGGGLFNDNGTTVPGVTEPC